MKSVTKKVLLLAMAIAVVCTFAVCAADEAVSPITPVATLGEDGTSVDVSYSIDGATPAQVTILVFRSQDADGNDVTDAAGNANVAFINADGTTNIAFIDQQINGAELDFVLNDDAADGTYTVYIGATDVAECGKTTFVKVTEQQQTAFTISGNIDGVVNLGDPDFNAMYQIMITLQDMDGNEIETKVIDGTDLIDEGETNGVVPFAFENLEPGAYNIVVIRIAKALKVITVANLESDVAIADTVSLLGVDAPNTYDGIVDAADVGEVLTAMAALEVGEDAYSFDLDCFFDGTIDSADVGEALTCMAAIEDGSYYIVIE